MTCLSVHHCDSLVIDSGRWFDLLVINNLHVLRNAWPAIVVGSSRGSSL